MISTPSGQVPVTLATIAVSLGISRSTVSNAYNHPDQLSSELRQRIFDQAELVGYTGPNAIARRLRQQRAAAIGVLFSEPLQYAFADPASTLLLEGIATAGEEADSALLLIPARPSAEGAHIVRDAIVDGFILYSIPPGHPFVEAALRRRLPIVCVDQTRIGGGSWVGIDDRASARDAGSHIVQLGHRRIAIVVYGLSTSESNRISQATATSSLSSSSQSSSSQGCSPSVSWVRIEGYAAAFRDASIDSSEIIVRECGRNTQDAGRDVARQILQSNDAPTAIICTSDLLAFGALQAADELNIPVPEQLSIIGFNDIPQAASSRPQLTTVRQPLVHKGYEAGKLLLTGQPGSEHNVLLDAELIVRASTGPAP